MRVDKNIGLKKINVKCSENLVQFKPDHYVVELEQGDHIMLTVPGFYGRSCVYIDVTKDGLLELTGGANIIGAIRADGIMDKVQDDKAKKDGK